jgi:hypothetical protein
VCIIDGRVEKIRRRPLEKLQQDLESERNAAASATAQVEKLNKEIEGQVVEEQAERFDAKVKKLDWSYRTIEEEVKKAVLGATTYKEVKEGRKEHQEIRVEQQEARKE